MTNEQYNVILQKLNMLVRLAALTFVSDKSNQEKIIMLRGAGFQPMDIADICGTTANTVRVALSTNRKKAKKKKASKLPNEIANTL
jgi:DNA-directed RNA polymerase specialized sigma24 family protein